MKRSKEVFEEYWYQQQELQRDYGRYEICSQWIASIPLARQRGEASLCERCMFFKMHKFADLSYADRI